MPRRDLFHFEFPEDGGGAPVEAPVEEAPVEEVWAGPSQEDWGNVTNTLGYLAEYVQSQQAPPAEDAYPDIDPFDPQQLGGFIRQQIQEAIAPVMDWQSQQQTGEAEERALDILEDFVSREGEFVLGEKAYPNILRNADAYYPEMAAKHGAGQGAAQAAIERAAKEWRELEQAAGQSAVERHMNQLTNLSGAGHELAASQSAPQAVVTEPGGDELSLVRKYGGIVPGYGPG